jgi:hypothetical protein
LIREASSRRLAMGIAALLAALLLPSGASAHRPRPPAQLDTVSVSGSNVPTGDFSALDIEVEASSGRSGENPSGTGSFDAGGILTITGPISCLNVNGNVAVMTVQGPFSNAPGFLGFSLRVVDNGGSGRDIFQWWPADPEFPDPIDCKVGALEWFGGALIGRAVVHDAALPTERRQCRRGGWASFGFASKKQCLRFVKRHRHRARHPH